MAEPRRAQGEPVVAVAGALPMPLLVIGHSLNIMFVNPAAEQFFDTGSGILLKQFINDLLPFDSPLFQLINQARERNSSAAERDVDLSTARHGERIVGEAGGGQDNLSTSTSDPQIIEKFRGLTEDLLGTRRVNALLERLWHLDEIEDISTLPSEIVVI